MIGPLLEKLQGLLPKRFFLAGLAPALLVFMMNGALLYHQNAAVRAWLVKSVLESSDDGGLTAAGLISLLLFVLALLLLIVNTFLRELLEGEHWPKSLQTAFARPHALEAEQKQAKLDKLFEERRELLATKTGLVDAWSQETNVAGYGADDISDFRTRYAGLKHGKTIRFEKVEPSAKKLLAAIASADPGIEPTAQIKQDYELIYDVLEARHRFLDGEITRIHNLVQSSFGDSIAPTTLGNVTATLRAYAASRYGMNFDLAWGPLQKVLQGEPFYEVVQDAKTTVDLVVSSFWLVVASLVFWISYFFGWGYKPWPAAMVLIGGALLLKFLYLLAIQSHRAFTGLIRTAIDVYRSKVLEALQIPLPSTATQERMLWWKLNRQMAFGDPVVLSYDPTKKE
jgi:hypothetical protein